MSDRLTLDEFSIRFLSNIFEQVKKETGVRDENELIIKVDDRINQSYQNYLGNNNEYN